MPYAGQAYHAWPSASMISAIYAVSQLIAQGASLLQVARVAGRADPSVTLRVYGHLMADALAEAARRYDPLRAVAVDEK
jgi:hypothetical protein